MYRSMQIITGTAHMQTHFLVTNLTTMNVSTAMTARPAKKALL